MHYGYVIVMCCCLMMGVNVGLIMSCAGIFYAPVSESLGVSIGEFSLYMSLSFITSSLALSVAGGMMERYSARMLLTVSSAVSGLCVAAMGFFTNVWEFYIAGCLIGVTLAFLLYLSFPTLINRWFNTKVGFMIGLCSASSGIGGVLFNPVGGWLITNYGWRSAYIVFGLIILVIVTPLLWALLRDYPSDKGLQKVGEKAVEKSVAQDGISYGHAVRMVVFYMLLVFAFLMMASSTLNLFIPKYVITLDFSLEQSAYAASAIMAGVTVGKLVLGYINDRNCALGVLVTTLFGIGGLLMLVFINSWLWAIVTGAFLFGWCYAGVTVQTAMLVRKVFGSMDYARIYSVISIALAAGGAIASGSWGFLAEHTSYTCIMWVGVGMLSASCLLGLLSLTSRQK